jgi:hypothetical protein
MGGQSQIANRGPEATLSYPNIDYLSNEQRRDRVSFQSASKSSPFWAIMQASGFLSILDSHARGRKCPCQAINKAAAKIGWLGHQSSEVGGRRTVITKGVAPTAGLDGGRGE